MTYSDIVVDGRQRVARIQVLSLPLLEITIAYNRNLAKCL